MGSPRPVLTLLAVLMALGACATPSAAARPVRSICGQPGTSPGAPHGQADRPAETLGVPGATAPGRRPPVVRNGPRRGHAVALTFDADMTDGMLRNLATGKVVSYANTRVIDILLRRRVPATFFLAGEWVQRYPALTRRLAADPGFELANHSYRHSGFVRRCYGLPPIDPALMSRDVARAFAVLAPYGGRQTRYFRFPGGCYDRAALNALAPLGLTVIQWDVVSGDAFATAARPIVDEVLSKVRPGSIIVMHMTEATARYTDEALPPILDGLAAKGLRPVTLSELLDGTAAGHPPAFQDTVRPRWAGPAGAGNGWLRRPG